MHSLIIATVLVFFQYCICDSQSEKRSIDHGFLREYHRASTIPSQSSDISFCIADLKFDGTTIKLCELGQGIESKFKGHEVLYGKGIIWASLWRYLHTYGIPVWYVSRKSGLNDVQEIALSEHTKRGGIVFPSFENLQSSSFLKKAVVRKNFVATDINTYSAILVCHGLTLNKKKLAEFKKKHPSILVMDNAFVDIVSDKYITNCLFDDDAIRHYKPAYARYEARYTPCLADQVSQHFNQKTVVIKPLDASLGRGVIITPSSALDDIFLMIFGQKQRLVDYKKDQSYFYWFRDRSQYFLVEEFAASKTIVVNGHPYDPTMRVVFIVSHDRGIINTTIIGAYWKLPEASLDDNGLLTQLHKSCINSKKISSASVDSSDVESVCSHLSYLLPVVYQKALVVS